MGVKFPEQEELELMKWLGGLEGQEFSNPEGWAAKLGKKVKKAGWKGKGKGKGKGKQQKDEKGKGEQKEQQAEKKEGGSRKLSREEETAKKTRDRWAKRLEYMAQWGVTEGEKKYKEQHQNRPKRQIRKEKKKRKRKEKKETEKQKKKEKAKKRRETMNRRNELKRQQRMLANAMSEFNQMQHYH